MGTKDIISKDLIKHLAFDLATILLKLDIDPDGLELLDTEKQRIGNSGDSLPNYSSATHVENKAR